MTAPMLTLSGRRPVVPTHPRGRSVRVPAWVFAVTALAVGASVVTGAQAAGWWVSGGLSASASQAGATGGSEQAAPTGTDPAEVKGWMTVQQIVDAYAVPVAELYAAFGVPAGTPATTELKDLEGLSGGRFEVTALRDWLAAR